MVVDERAEARALVELVEASIRDFVDQATGKIRALALTIALFHRVRELCEASVGGRDVEWWYEQDREIVSEFYQTTRALARVLNRMADSVPPELRGSAGL